MKKLILLGVVLFGFITSCTHDPLAPDTQYICDQGGVDYVAEIQPMLTSNCGMSGCHGSGDSKAGVSVDSYSGVEKIVRRYNLDKSDLWTVINATGEKRMPPGSASELSAAQKDLIKRWIMEGAQETDCGGSCSYVSVPSYSTDISPIADTYCGGTCHSGSSPSGGFTLTSKSDWANAIDNHGLIDALTGANGRQLMPPTGSMDTCNINNVKRWDNTGRSN